MANPWIVDGAIVALVAVLMILEFTFADPKDPMFQGPMVGALAAICVGALLFRRRGAFAALVVVACAEFVWILVTGNSPATADRIMLMAVYSVAVYRDRRWAAGGVALAMFAWSSYFFSLPARHACVCMVEIGTLATLAVIAGIGVAAGRRLNAELRDKTELLARTREERIRLAVLGERVRVAREMHDVVAHGMTVMVVQAGGARMVAATDPEGAGEALAVVERTGREVLQELRTLVGSLEDDEGRARLVPADGRRSIRSLVDEARANGLEVGLQVQGESEQLDEGVDISLYRIVQEALTNVRKHAPGARADVFVRYLPQAVEVEVANTRSMGIATTWTIPGAGQGLIGISERAAVFGGEARAGPASDGGFRVSARLPLELVPA